ncbi:unnamed protein product [Caenorhabditis brenneri]
MEMCNNDMDLASKSFSVQGVTYTRNDDFLGKGAFGVVFGGSGSDGSTVAIKCQFVGERNSRKSIVQEYDIHWDLTKKDTSGHVIRLFGMNKIPQMISFVVEFAPQSLYDKLKMKSVTPEEAHHYFRMLVDGIEFLHSEMVVHCDIKPENLLICDERLKLADFGKAKRMKNMDQKYKSEESIGTKKYAAPELWKEEIVQGRPLDVWCCGIVLLQLSQASLEIWEMTDVSDKQYSRWMELIKGGKVTRSDFCYKFKLATMNLLKRMLCVEPEKRITIEEIKEDPCYTGETATRKRKATGNTGKAAKKGKK